MAAQRKLLLRAMAPAACLLVLLFVGAATGVMVVQKGSTPPNPPTRLRDCPMGWQPLLVRFRPPRHGGKLRRVCVDGLHERRAKASVILFRRSGTIPLTSTTAEVSLTPSTTSRHVLADTSSTSALQMHCTTPAFTFLAVAPCCVNAAHRLRPVAGHYPANTSTQGA